ncbi:MAG: radical SAM protein [bacterium]
MISERTIKRLTIKINSDCNLDRCKYCYTTQTFSDPKFNSDKHKGLELGVYKDLIKQLVNNQPKGTLEQISITGGEPFLRKDLFEIVEYGLSNDIDVRINTNGTLISENLAIEFAELVSRYRKKLIFQIGLDSSDRRVHEYIRGKGTFDATVQGIKYILESKNSISPSLKVVLRYTLLKKFYQNGNEIIYQKEPVKDAIDYIYFAHKISSGYKQGIDKLKMRELLTTGRGIALKNMMYSPEEVVKVQKAWVDKIGGYNMNLELTWPCYLDGIIKTREGIEKVEIPECRCVNDYITIDETGRVVVCVLLMNHPEQYLGNILVDNIFEIFRSDKTKAMLKEREDHKKKYGSNRCFAIDHTHQEVGVDINERINKMKKLCKKLKNKGGYN